MKRSVYWRRPSSPNGVVYGNQPSFSSNLPRPSAGLPFLRHRQYDAPLPSMHGMPKNPQPGWLPPFPNQGPIYLPTRAHQSRSRIVEDEANRTEDEWLSALRLIPYTSLYIYLISTECSENFVHERSIADETRVAPVSCCRDPVSKG